MLICISGCFFFLTDDETKLHQRLKREAFQSDPKSYLDQVIEHLIFTIPSQIDESIGQSETDLKLTVAKRVTQVRY